MTVPSEKDPSDGSAYDEKRRPRPTWRALECGWRLRAPARSGPMRLFLTGEGETEVVRAVESDPDRDDPGRVVSPVYQEVQRHLGVEGSSLCLLATGTLYHHHFSAVITLGADRDRQNGVVLEIDVADRCRRAVEIMAATYTVRLDSGALAAAGPEAIAWDIDARSCRPARARGGCPEHVGIGRGRPIGDARAGPRGAYSLAASRIGCITAGAGRAALD